MNFLAKNQNELITDLLRTNTKELLILWGNIQEKDKDSALVNLEKAVHFAQRTLFQQMRKIIDTRYEINPLDSINLATRVAAAKNKTELLNFAQKAKLRFKEFQLSEIQPYAKNGLNLLEKTYLCITYENAYQYVQTAKVVANIDRGKIIQQIEDLQLAHDNLATLLLWYQIAHRMSEGFFIDDNEEFIKRYSDQTKYYPSLEVVEDVLMTTIDIIKEMNIFPSIILQTLMQSPDLTQFFVSIDALVLALKTPKSGDELTVRKKLAYLYMIRDYIIDTSYWLSAKEG